MRIYNLILAIIWLFIAMISVLKAVESRYIIFYCTCSIIHTIITMTFSIEEKLKKFKEEDNKF